MKLTAVLALIVLSLSAVTAFDSCNSGIAQLELEQSNCTETVTAISFLFGHNVTAGYPWDCYQRVQAQAHSCQLTVMPNPGESAMTSGFSCRYLQYQGNVTSDTTGNMTLWIRFVPVFKLMLENVDLTSVWEQGPPLNPNAPVAVAPTAPAPLAKDVSDLSDVDLEGQTEETDTTTTDTTTTTTEPDLAPAATPLAPVNAADANTNAKRLLLQLLDMLEPSEESYNPGRALQQTAPTTTGTGNNLPTVMEKQYQLSQNLRGWSQVWTEDGKVIMNLNGQCRMVYRISSGGFLGVGEVDKSTMHVHLMGPEEQTRPDYSPGLSGGEIALIVLCVLLGLALLGGLGFFLYKRKHSKSSSKAIGMSYLDGTSGASGNGLQMSSSIDHLHQQHLHPQV